MELQVLFNGHMCELSPSGELSAKRKLKKRELVKKVNQQKRNFCFHLKLNFQRSRTRAKYPSADNFIKQAV